MKEAIRVTIQTNVIIPPAAQQAGATMRVGILQMARPSPNPNEPPIPGVVGMIIEDGKGGRCIVALSPEVAPGIMGMVGVSTALCADSLPPIFDPKEAEILQGKLDAWMPRIIPGGRA